MPKQSQKRQTNPISFRSPKVTTEQLRILVEIDGENVSRIIIRAINEYYRKRITEQTDREQA